MPETSQQPQSKTFIINYIRGLGAILMLVGVSLAFNIHGIPSAIGLTDTMTQEILGGFTFVIGIVDFFVLPIILAKKSGGQP